MAGLLKARLPDVQLERLDDPRAKRGRRWAFSTLLKTAVAGLAAGMKSFGQLEALTENLSVGMRRCLGISRRVPDTTMRDALVAASPEVLRRGIHNQIKAALRRKALEPVGLPFGVVALDGKNITLEAWDDVYAQRHTHKDKSGACGQLRTITCCLISSAAKVCLDAIPLLANTNEVGFFREALRQLVSTYGTRLFRMVSYDAGGCSEENADFVVSLGLDYLFAIKPNQPGIFKNFEFFLGRQKPEAALAQTQDVLSNKNIVTRRVFLVEKKPLYRWAHAHTFIRVDSIIHDADGALVKQKTSDGKLVDCVTRYFLSSAGQAVLTPAQWLLVVRRHWAVENNIHHTLDTAFREDDFPFMPSSPVGSLNVLLLRRIAFNMLALFRSVTQRSEDKRATPWLTLFGQLYIALVSASLEAVAGLRTRVVAAS